MNSFVERLQEIIGENSANSFAKRAGIGESTFRKYLAGSMPSIDNAAKIAKAAGVALQWLATGEGPKFPDEKSSPQAQPQSQSSLVSEVDEQAVLARLRRIEAEFYAASEPLPFTGPLAARRGELVEIATDEKMPDSARTLADRLLSAGFDDKQAERRMDARWERHAARQRLMRSKIEAIAAREFTGTVSPHFIGHLTTLALSHPLSETDIQLILTGAHLLTYEALGKLDLGWKPDLK